MNEKDKKILDLASRFIEKQGCLWAEFDVDAYSYQVYGGRKFQCGTSEKEQGVYINLPFEIGEIITEILNERNSDIPEELDDWDSSGYLQSVNVKLYPKERKFKVYGVYQVSVTLEELVSEFEMPDEVVSILTNAGINKGTVEFNGGGDSGYIEDAISSVNGTNSVGAIDDNGNLDAFLYRVLDDYGDWYNNEGASGNIELDVDNKTATYHIWPNDYAYEDEFLFDIDF
jgi:hypothetical protein